MKKTKNYTVSKNSTTTKSVVPGKDECPIRRILHVCTFMPDDFVKKRERQGGATMGIDNMQGWVSQETDQQLNQDDTSVGRYRKITQEMHQEIHQAILVKWFKEVVKRSRNLDISMHDCHHLAKKKLLGQE